MCRTAVGALGLSAAVVSLMAADARGGVGSEAIAAAWGAGGRAVEELQLSVGEGPSRDAFAGRRPVLASDLDQAMGWWPGYVPAARAADVVSVFAFPLSLGAVRLGVLTLYGATSRTLSARELGDCLVLCEMATRLLLDAPMGGTGTVGSVLAQLQFRDSVYQAQGMTMVALDVSLEEALARMRARAFAAGQDLSVLAAEIIAGTASLSDDLGDGGRE